MNFSLLAAPETLTSTSTQLTPSVDQSTLLNNSNNNNGDNNDNEIINSIIKRHKQELEKINNQNFLIKKENVTLKKKLELMRKKMKNMMIEERNKKSLPTHVLDSRNHHHSTGFNNFIDKDIDNDFI